MVELELPVPLLMLVESISIDVSKPETVEEPPEVDDTVVALAEEVRSNTLKVLS